MIKNVFRFYGGKVIVFDEKGKVLSDYCGQYEDVKEKVLKDSPEKAQFFMKP